MIFIWNYQFLKTVLQTANWIDSKYINTSQYFILIELINEFNLIENCNKMGLNQSIGKIQTNLKLNNN